MTKLTEILREDVRAPITIARGRHVELLRGAGSGGLRVCHEEGYRSAIDSPIRPC